MLRTILAVIFAVLFLILSMPVLLVLNIIGRKHPEKRDRAAMAIVQWALRVVLFISETKITVIGEENILSDQAALYVGNHRSIFDIIATYPQMKLPGGYIAKDSLEKIPLLRLWMRYIYCFFLNREDPKSGMQTILDAVKQIKAGKNVYIFAEGTRNKGTDDAELLPFHEGSFRVATKTGCPIIPVAINNSVNTFEAHFPRIRRTHIVIEFCKPVDPSGMTRDEKKHVGAYVRDIIAETISKNKALV